MLHRLMQGGRNVGARETGETNYCFKILYALGMIFVVSGHAEGGGMTLFYDWFPPYAFHMGLFVFCSGYFYKDGYEQNVGSFIRRKAKTLLLPMYLWNFFYAFLLIVLRKADFNIGLDVNFRTLLLMPLYEGSQFELNMGAWFVVPLFLAEVITVLLRKFSPGSPSKSRELAFFVISLLLGALGVYLAQHGFRRMWELTVVRTLYFLPFYALGIFYRRVLEPHDRLSNLKYFAVVLLLQYVIILLCGRIPYYTPSRCDDFIEGGIIPFIVGFVPIAFWLRVSKILEPSLGREKWVNTIADNGYSIMVNQYLGFMCLKSCFAALKFVTGRCQDFDMVQFKSNIAYFYAPGGPLFYIFYLAAGLLVPIVMQKFVSFVWQNVRRRLRTGTVKI